jgi:hypothetical protein
LLRQAIAGQSLADVPLPPESDRVADIELLPLRAAITGRKLTLFDHLAGGIDYFPDHLRDEGGD